MTWAATVQARDGQVEVRLTRYSEAVRMDPQVARTLAATLLVVAESAEPFEAEPQPEPETVPCAPSTT